jgi:uncharacterized protein YdeI (YjbR/CyaY-like superfamily)
MGKSRSDAGNMPIGLMMSLAQHQQAMKNFSLLDDEQQKSILRYVEDSRTGEEARNRIENAVNNLEQGNNSFFG